jgi:hypothetical protein
MLDTSDRKILYQIVEGNFVYMCVLQAAARSRTIAKRPACVTTQCGPKVLGLIFLKIVDTPFLIQNKLHWHIYRLLRGRAVSEKLPKIPLFGPSLIHQLRLLGSQQHPQSGVFLCSFST